MTSGDDHTSGRASGDTAASLREVCQAAGLDDTGAELLRYGSNAVYRLASAPVVVRMSRDLAALPELERAVGVARWLSAVDYPAIRALPGVRQPVTVASRVVTFWESAHDSDTYGSTKELAGLLLRLHRLEAPESLGLPCFDPFAKMWGPLRELAGVAEDDRAFLEERAGKLQESYDRLDYVLPFGLIHGDANVGNVLRGRDGRAVLIDLDGFSLAQREWDLVLTALYYERFGWHTRGEYESFVYHYGFDLLNWPGYPVLADVRELMMVLWLAGKAAADQRSGEEFGRRVHALRTGGSRRDWRPF